MTECLFIFIKICLNICSKVVISLFRILPKLTKLEGDLSALYRVPAPCCPTVYITWSAYKDKLNDREKYKERQIEERIEKETKIEKMRKKERQKVMPKADYQNI
jgi:hypothetical protein